MPNHTIAENLTRLQNARSSIASAISAKGGTVSASDGYEDFPAAIASIPSGGVLPSGGGGLRTARGTILFLDYDGTVIYSYTKEEFLQLSSLPDNPTHDGLTSQGWNWSLSDAKTYLSNHEALNIGQTYAPNDSNTRIYVDIPENRLSPTLKVYLEADPSYAYVEIDWGDGSSRSVWFENSSGFKSEQHTYPAPGKYVISIIVHNGYVRLESSIPTTMSTLLTDGNNSLQSPDRAFLNSIYRVELSPGIKLGPGAFYYCSMLSSVVIPLNITTIPQYAFSRCSSLFSVIIPKTTTTLDANCFYDDSSLASVSLPNNITTLGNSVFNQCRALYSISLPDTIDSVGSSMFNSCSSLSDIQYPESATTIPSSFVNGCISLKYFTIPSNITSIGQSAFNGCAGLSKLTIPNSVTTLGTSAFVSCSSLTKLDLPNNFTIISSTLFNGCQSLVSLTIPASVTSIGSNAFNACQHLEYIKFESSTPPSALANAFGASGGILSTNTKILVPTGSLNAYQSATNYPNPSNYTYEEY